MFTSCSFQIDVAIFKCKRLICFARQLRQSSSKQTPRNLKYYELTQYILLIFYSFGPELWKQNDEWLIHNIRYYANVCKCLPSIDNLPKIPGPIKWHPWESVEKFDGLLRRNIKIPEAPLELYSSGSLLVQQFGASPTHPAGPRAFFAKSENSIRELTCLNGLLFISSPSMIYLLTSSICVIIIFTCLGQWTWMKHFLFYDL